MLTEDDPRTISIQFVTGWCLFPSTDPKLISGRQKTSAHGYKVHIGPVKTNCILVVGGNPDVPAEDLHVQMLEHCTQINSSAGIKDHKCNIVFDVTCFFATENKMGRVQMGVGAASLIVFAGETQQRDVNENQARIRLRPALGHRLINHAKVRLEFICSISVMKGPLCVTTSNTLLILILKHYASQAGK